MAKYNFKIGIMLDSLRLPVDEALAEAHRLGAEGIQVYCVGGDLHPDRLTGQARQDFLAKVRDNGLVISAWCGELGGFVVDRPEAEHRVSETLKFLELTAATGIKVLTAHVGSFRGQPQDKVDNCRWALEQVGKRAEKLGVTFATETGAEPADELRTFLDDLGQPGLGVNYDPANLVMKGWDHLEGVKVLRDYVVHTHAKDGLLGQGKEVALGDGDVDFPGWVANLNAIGFHGFLAIEREVGENPSADIARAIGFLQKLRSGK